MNYIKPIGFFESQRALRSLEKYLDLVRHFFNFGEGIMQAKQLETLIPNFQKEESYFLLRNEILSCSNDVYIRMLRINFQTHLAYQKVEYLENGKTKIIKKEVDMFHNILKLQSITNLTHQQIYEQLTENLIMAIGFYKKIRSRSWKLWFNPIWIIAYFLRIPISIMEFMGVNVNSDKTNNFVVWIVYTLCGIVYLKCHKLFQLIL
jgi:hypothetical protein